MDVKIALALAGIGFEIISSILYYRDIFRGKTKPHLFTFLVWSIVTTIAFLGQVVGGGEAGSWITAASALMIISVVPLCFWFGTKDITRSDTFFLVAALLSIIPWLLTKNPLWSVILVTLIDALAMIPTLRKTWRDPSTESLPAWIASEAKILCGIAALAVYTPLTWIYPVQAFTMNGVLIAIILMRRNPVLGNIRDSNSLRS